MQAAAAIGQSLLIEAYNKAFEKHGRHAAQVLLVADDMNDRRRYLNVRNTLDALFDYGAIPIVNENDTVRTDELSRNMGDNDRLAAMVTNLLRAPLLIILTDVDGLYDGDPEDDQSNVIDMVEEMDAQTEALAQSGVKRSGPSLSRGGMASKLEAAQIAIDAGESVILANGRRENVLVDLLAGEPIGTLLPGNGGQVSPRKRWIGWAAQPLGCVSLDEGAVRAIEEKGKSLLPVGITGVTGKFDKGDVVSLCDPTGEEFARGLTNYTATDLERIAGQPTDGVSEILGRVPYVEAVHRNHLALVRSPGTS
jgi:glutamate 5-kinase